MEKFLAVLECTGQEAVFPFKSREMGVLSWLSQPSSYRFGLSRWERPGEGERLEQLIGKGFFGKVFLSPFFAHLGTNQAKLLAFGVVAVAVPDPSPGQRDGGGGGSGKRQIPAPD